jgi:transcriptional regulator with XRE-family HTH domain
MPTKEEVGRRVRLARFKHDMTLKEVAKRSGMSATHISEIERGKTSPTIGALQRIADALDERPAHFVEEHTVAPVLLTRRSERVRDYSCDMEHRITETERLAGGVPWGTLYVVRRSGAPGERVDRQPALGELLLLCLKGMVRIDVSDESHVLRDGDAVHFNLGDGFSAETIGDETSDVIAIASLAGRSYW